MDLKKIICSMCGKTIEAGQEYTYVSPNGAESPICEECFNKTDDIADPPELSENIDAESDRPMASVIKTSNKKTKNNQKRTGNYKCVPAPTEIVIYRQDDYYTAAKYFEDIINDETNDGWKYVGMESVSTIRPAGCLAALFGKKAEVTYFNMLIFEKNMDKGDN